MKNRNYPRVTVTKKQASRIHDGHPWIYQDEITSDNSQLENGCLVDVFGTKDNYLGTGFYSEKSKISIRLLTNDPNVTINEDFYNRRIAHAIQYRLDTMQDQIKACRLVHGESDFLPGLTIDRYNNILVSEITCFGMEQVKDVIYKALIDQLDKIGEHIDGIYERNENALRIKEGLTQYKGWYGKESNTTTIIEEYGIKYLVDVENGQKTGFFLDQKENRVAVRKLARNKEVLDCCCHTGSFALNAAYGKAKSVIALDISDTALNTARYNAKINQLEDKVIFLQGDVFEVLQTYRKEHKHFDFIILDPPAFTKSRKTQHNAYQGYQKINALAMKILPRGGYLATNSCSHFMPSELFEQMLHDAARDAGVKVRIVEQRYASYDHPVLIGVDETKYLKYFLVQIV